MMRTPKPSLKSARAGANFQVLFGASSGDSVLSGLKLVALNRISTGAQPRTQFPLSEIEELAKSISELRERGEGIEGTGILQPLLVTRIIGNSEEIPYRLVAGERRLRASKQIGLEEVPVIEIKGGVEGQLDYHESNLLAMQLIENLQRRDLPPLDEARAFKQMMELRGLSQREAAQLLGKSRGYIQNRLDLLQMGDDIHLMVDSRASTLRVATHINRVSDVALRTELIRRVLEDDWSERDVLRSISTQAEDSSKNSNPQVKNDHSNRAIEVRSESVNTTTDEVPKQSTPSISDAANQAESALRSILLICDKPISIKEKRKLLKSLKEIEVTIFKLRERVG